MSKVLNNMSIRLARRSVPAMPPELPTAEDLRKRIILGRVRSPALAAVIAGHAFAVGAAR